MLNNNTPASSSKINYTKLLLIYFYSTVTCFGDGEKVNIGLYSVELCSSRIISSMGRGSQLENTSSTTHYYHGQMLFNKLTTIISRVWEPYIPAFRSRTSWYKVTNCSE